jgi:hypothetical protein
MAQGTNVFRESPNATISEEALTPVDQTFYLENRKEPRFHGQTPILCKFYNSDNFYEDEFISQDALTINYSNHGLCFEAPSPLEIELSVVIGLKESHGFVQLPEIGEQIHHAEIKWCKPTLSASHGNLYRIGVEFYEPLIVQRRLWAFENIGPDRDNHTLSRYISG